MKLADISIKRPVFALMMAVALVVFGLFAYPRVGIDLFPNVEFPVVTVFVSYPGADPASMESKVADPVEEAINTMSGIKSLRSVNLESVTQVIIEFDLSVDASKAVQDVRDRVASIARDLPQGIDPPTIRKFDIGAAPIMSVALAGNLPPRELTALAEDVVKERIQRLTGVGAVELIGGREREIHIVVDPGKLAGRGLTVGDVATALQAQNLDLPAGHIEEGQRELSVTTRGEVRSLQEIADMAIGPSVRIGDVAEVLDTEEEARSHSAIDGTSAVALVVQKQSGANTVAVARAVHAELEAMRPQLEQAGAHLTVPSDNAPYIERAIEDVRFDLLFGALLAVLIIMFFLRDLRATLISATALPISVIGTVFFIQLMGFTFNTMTMLALSLSIGILIDDAIVVIENIHRHLEMGKSPMQAAGDATGEIGLAVLATTFSIIAVFVPVAVMKGIIGRFFFQFGMTVSFAVLISLFVSFTVTPMLSSRYLKKSHGRPNLLSRGIERVLTAVDRAYHVLLSAALRHKIITIVVAGAALFGSCKMVSQVKAEFLPPEDRALMNVSVELPVGTSLTTTTGYVDALAADLKQHAPGALSTFVTVGGGSRAQVNVGQIQLNLVPSKQRPYTQQDVMAWVRKRYTELPSAKVSVTEIDAVGGGDSGFDSQPIQFSIRGRDMDQLIAAAEALKDELRKVKGFVDIDSSYRGGKPELAIAIDRDRAADLGVPVATIAATLRSLIAGDKITDYKDNLELYDVRMQMSDQDKNGLASLSNLTVRSTSGELVALSSVVDVERGEGPSQITRRSRQREIIVYAGLENLALGEASAKLHEAAAQVVPDTLVSEDAGMGKMMEESFGYMFTALILAIILVYMILAAQFDSLVHPFTIMLSLPMAVIGAFGALFITGMTLNIFSMIGVIMLMGLVTKNAILLIDFTNTLRKQGKEVREALLEAGTIRLRPILMTTLAMIFGMMPVALALGEGGEQRAPMAVVVIGGLITSTILTLVVVPVVYAIVDSLSIRKLIRFPGAIVRRVRRRGDRA